jgi:predicted amidohydrolase
MRVINEAAVCEPLLIVLPEFCNTLFCNMPLGNTQAWYVDHNQAWDQALAIEGAFLQQIAEQAKKHDCYIVINVTLRRDKLRGHQNGAIKSNISVTSCLFSPHGKLIHQEDKQTLTGHEGHFFIHASKVSEVIAAPFGKLGLLTGSDTMTFEPSRRLSLNGAQLLCNVINAFSIDQSHLHDPTRAFENNVFLATANKIGPFIPQEQSLELSPVQEGGISEGNNSAQHYVVGGGQSQIISPDGKVLAKLADNKEGFVFADICLAEIGLNKQCRPDGTPLIKQRRPELYQKLMAPIKQAQLMRAVPENEQEFDHHKVPVTANVAIFATYKSNEYAIDDVCHYIENNLSDIIQLPELFFLADKTVTNNTEQLAKIACLSEQLIAQISAVLRPFQYVSTSLVIEGMHQAVLISEHGLLEKQQQLHFCQRYQWTALGDEINIIELPLEQGNITIAMLTADDANNPEIVNLAALNHIHLLLVAFDIQAPCEVEYSLLSRAAENRVCIVAASREKSFSDDLSTKNKSNINNIYSKNKVKAHKSTGLIVNLTTHFERLTSWQSRKFNAYISQPLVKYQYGKITKAVIHPIAACDKSIKVN